MRTSKQAARGYLSAAAYRFPISDTSGPFAGSPGQNPIINNNGTVVFFAMLDTGEIGLFTGPDPVADRVIATGDPLLGSIVVDFPTNGAGLALTTRAKWRSPHPSPMAGEFWFVLIRSASYRNPRRSPCGRPERSCYSLFG
jgi:hypothetical protein